MREPFMPAPLISAGVWLPEYAPKHARSLRLRAIAAWSEAGLGTSRSPFPIELAFARRLDRHAGPGFIPLRLPDSDSVAYHREVSLLIDAFDAFPQRVDISFDSMWRAFEAGLHDLRRAGDNNTTNALSEFARNLQADELSAVEVATCALPQQALEFLVARWIEGAAEGNKLSRRLAKAGSAFGGAGSLREHLRGQYDLSDMQHRRKAARLLFLMMRGRPVIVSGIPFKLSANDRAIVLMSGLLFGLRNDRAHGAVPSPFTSSAATLRTYTLPYYAFVTTYYLYMVTALRRGHLGSEFTVDALRRNLGGNLDAARAVMGWHWDA